MKRDEIEDKTLSFTESLKMLDNINNCSFSDEESHKTLSTVTKKLENLQLQNKKQLLTFDFCFEVVAFDLLFFK